MKNNFNSAVEKGSQLQELLKLIIEGGENTPHLLYDLAIEKCYEIAQIIEARKPQKDCIKTSEQIEEDPINRYEEENIEIYKEETTTDYNISETGAEAEDNKPEEEATSISETPSVTIELEPARETRIIFESNTTATSEIKFKKIRETICINDLFLFKRELFGNDDRLMQSVFSEIDRTTCFEDAERLLLELFEWNTEEDSFAADFMQKVENRFK